MALNDNLKAMLKKTHDNAVAAGGFTFLNPKNPLVAPLLAQGFLEQDASTTDKADAAKVAMRLTALGLAEIGATAAPDAPPVGFTVSPAPGTPGTEAMALPPSAGVPVAESSPKAKPTISRTGTFMPLPEKAGRAPGSHRKESFPFSTLAEPVLAEDGETKLYDSFFVHATPAMPNPGKSMAGTVSSATKRYKDQTPPRKFSLVPVDKDHEHGVAGARVLRTV
jgi:hypothetical protein